MVPPPQRMGDSWYVGTADAIYQNLYLLERSGADNVLILSGDHIYRMDYLAMLAAHTASGADCTLACMEVPLAEATSFGVVTVDSQSQIVEFADKPEQPKPMPDDRAQALGSRGIYVFSLPFWCSLLEADHRDPP